MTTGSAAATGRIRSSRSRHKIRTALPTEANVHAGWMSMSRTFSRYFLGRAPLD